MERTLVGSMPDQMAESVPKNVTVRTENNLTKTNIIQHALYNHLICKGLILMENRLLSVVDF